MSETEVLEPEEDNDQDGGAISFKDFLENSPSSVEKLISDLWDFDEASGLPKKKKISTPDLRLYCQQCEGERTFRALPLVSHHYTVVFVNAHPFYRCGDCGIQSKQYALRLKFEENGGSAYKFGELPPFGIPVSNRVLRLFGGDAKLFQKGRLCESAGLGIAAFAYYRRVVESHKDELFDEIIKVCRTVDASNPLVAELRAAKSEVLFSKAIEQIKSGLPQGLLIDGQNPLTALYKALSEGLHSESDEACLAKAHAVRLVLTKLIENIALLKQDNKEITEAMKLLMSKRSEPPEVGGSRPGKAAKKAPGKSELPGNPSA